MSRSVNLSRNRTFTTLVLALAVAAMLAIALPRQADAAADGCVTSFHPSSCVRVVGSGLWVDTVAPGVHLIQRQSTHGYFHIWGSGFNKVTHARTYWNRSYWHGRTMWYPALRIRRNLRDGSKVCAQLIDAEGARSPACETIHR